MLSSFVISLLTAITLFVNPLSIVFFILSMGPAIATAATTRFSWNTGAAMQRTPTNRSSSSMANPWFLITSKW